MSRPLDLDALAESLTLASPGPWRIAWCGGADEAHAQSRADAYAIAAIMAARAELLRLARIGQAAEAYVRAERAALAVDPSLGDEEFEAALDAARERRRATRAALFAMVPEVSR